MELIKKEQRFNIIGAAMEVHNNIGCGFTEYVYQDALEIEFSLRGIPFEREKHLTVNYKGICLKHDYFADFVCYGDIIVECKATKAIDKAHEAQTINYLNAARYPLGILLNFGEASLNYKYYVFKQYLNLRNS